MTAPASQRVVVTGCGALSPLGMTAANIVSGVAAGRSGIRRVTRTVQMGLPVTTAGEVEGLPLGTRERELEMSRRPIAEALAQSGLAPARAAFVWTTGLDTFRDEGEAPGATSAGARFATLARDFGGPTPDDRDRLLGGDAGDRRGVPPGPPRPRGRRRRGRRDDDGDAVLPRRVLLAAGPGAGPRTRRR